MTKKNTTLEASSVDLACELFGRLWKLTINVAIRFGWIIWLNIMMSVMGYGITTWQWWATIIPVLILEGLAAVYSSANVPDHRSPATGGQHDE
jgi:CHASE2 domain-containing sensor protein